MPSSRKSVSATDSGEPASPRFFNRDLSWLEFNRRVLAQASDEGLPLLDRVRFLTIFTSNLDEFFMKRVGLLKRTVHAGVDAVAPDGMTPRQQLLAIRGMVTELCASQIEIYNNQIRPALDHAGLSVVRYADLSGKDRKWAEDWYRANVFPTLTPLAVDPTHRFPFISNLSTNLAVVAEPPTNAHTLTDRSGASPGFEAAERLFARLKFPANIKRFIALPNRDGATSAVRLVQVNDIIRNNLDDLFPGMKLAETVAFRVTRSAGIQKDDLDTANLLQSIEADLKQRRFARVVRVEMEPSASPAVERWLCDKLNVETRDIYDMPLDIDFLGLSEICDIDRPDLKHKPWKPVIPSRLAPAVLQPVSDKNSANFFAAIRKQDILVHHPYESFAASVERFIAAAASDPDVLTIKQTLYRTSPDSPFIAHLIRAAESGKQVACLVELRARFDEDRNVRFARVLEKAGVHVAYGVQGLKTHCKTSLVVRKERHGLRCYAHFGTGNYHPKTAQLYTDVGLLTADPDMTGDLVNLFNFLTGLAATQEYHTLLVAPTCMRTKFNAMIDREIEFAKKGAPARIIAKINSMEDRETTDRLYAASQAGVKITLIVRGFCCLRTGVPGLSDNIRVLSIVGRFLRHSRIFHFGAGREDMLDGEWYMASADWMYRNLSNRVEVGVPVRDPVARAKLAEIITTHLADHRHAWELSADGEYHRRVAPSETPADSPMALGTFETLMRAAASES
ncbi:MAG: polyphosphate kinase 1 [Planctomycetota bacterium]|nr:polyphosphate kinase 1 [Planctomycetota bacterium]